jgi:hypothetical protein
VIWKPSQREFDMAVNPNYHEETVLADSPEEQQFIANLTAQGWTLYACPDVGKSGYVRLMFRKADPPIVYPFPSTPY